LERGTNGALVLGMRLVASVALVAFVALPACEFGTEGPAPGAPDDGKACPLPRPEDSCTAQECNERGGCSIFTCDEIAGEWRETFCDPAPPPPPELDGRWILFRTIPDDPCPEITRVDPFELLATRAIGGGEAVSSLDGTRLSLGEVRLFGFTSQVIFGFDETWSAGEASLPVRVDYDLTFFDGGDIEGKATASVPLGERTCEYTFAVNGARS
jgi:hypothetical protein